MFLVEGPLLLMDEDILKSLVVVPNSLIIVKERTTHENWWIWYGLPQGYKSTTEHNVVQCNPSANMTDVVSHTSNDSFTTQSDKPNIQCSFSQEQYEAILGLLKQYQTSTPPMGTVNQCTKQSLGPSSISKFSSWIIDSRATDHICSSKFFFF